MDKGYFTFFQFPLLGSEGGNPWRPPKRSETLSIPFVGFKVLNVSPSLVYYHVTFNSLCWVLIFCILLGVPLGGFQFPLLGSQCAISQYLEQVDIPFNSLCWVPIQVFAQGLDGNTSFNSLCWVQAIKQVPYEVSDVLLSIPFVGFVAAGKEALARVLRLSIPFVGFLSGIIGNRLFRYPPLSIPFVGFRCITFPYFLIKSFKVLPIFQFPLLGS